MTAEEYTRDAMAAFKESAFDAVAVGWIERAMTRAIRAAVAEEREACAAIAELDSMKDWSGGSTGMAVGTARNIAAAIRARGK